MYYVTGQKTLPNGLQCDRIYHPGGGDCYLYSVSQGCSFYGVYITHAELRTKVGQWLQNPDNALWMAMTLGLQPIHLLSHLNRFPAPHGGWATYLRGMTWVDGGVHVQQQGGWVGPLEITSTNCVLQEMGSDIRVNIYDPLCNYILGNEENVRADGLLKPIIMIISEGGHYEWLRHRDN